jgi:hypothetical protein
MRVIGQYRLRSGSEIVCFTIQETTTDVLIENFNAEGTILYGRDEARSIYKFLLSVGYTIVR